MRPHGPHLAGPEPSNTPDSHSPRPPSPPLVRRAPTPIWASIAGDEQHGRNPATPRKQSRRHILPLPPVIKRTNRARGRLNHVIFTSFEGGLKVVAVCTAKPKGCLSGMRVPGLGHHQQGDGASDPRHLGILAFEAARTMSRLVALHRALSDAEVARVRSATMRSEGVAYLNSPDQSFLLRLACAEMVNDLDAAAAAAARLGSRCRGVWPWGFEHEYADIKAGTGDISRLRLWVQPKDVEKKVKKMERYVASTTALCVAMEVLAELEAGGKRRLGNSKQWAGQGQEDAAFKSLQKRTIQQRERVRQLRQESLWGRSFDKVAELMARSVLSIFARMCIVYGSFVMEIPRVIIGKHGRPQFAPHSYSGLCSHHHHDVANRSSGFYSSGPLERPFKGNVLLRNSGPILRSARNAADAKSWKEQTLAPPPNTLGASGLALRYAKVVVLLDKLARLPELVGKDTREELYCMLPEGMCGAVMAKLRSHRRMDYGGGPAEALASGWKQAAEAILGWLGPMAHDTVRWHSERGFEQREMESGPRVLSLQTLTFADREKAEAAIVELLVALSFVCRYEQCWCDC